MAHAYARSAPTTALADLVRSTEARGNGSLAASLLLLENGRLCHEAASGLPEAYCEAIDGIKIGPKTASCGTAAFCGHPIYVPDIAEDVLWAPWPELAEMAMQAGFRACWSVPIVDRDRRVLSTFSISDKTWPWTHCVRSFIMASMRSTSARGLSTSSCQFRSARSARRSRASKTPCNSMATATATI